MEAGERLLVADGRCVLRAPAHVVRDLRSGAVIGFETVAEEHVVDVVLVATRPAFVDHAEHRVELSAV